MTVTTINRAPKVYVDFAKLTIDQKKEVIGLYPGTSLEELKKRAFRLRKNQHVSRVASDYEWTAAEHKRLSKESRKQLDDLFDGPPAHPDKGDIHHLKTCTFSLGKES